jgi:hypothetical protein
MPGRGGAVISVVAEGPADVSRLARLEDVLPGTSVAEVPAGMTLEPSSLNPLVDAAVSNWILIVRTGERVGTDLALEIVRGAREDPRAWGYRIGRRLVYRGETLTLGRREPGDIRLFNRRKARMQPNGRMKVYGPVVRLASMFDLVVHESESDHEAALVHAGRQKASLVRHLAVFVASMVRWAPGSLTWPARRYLWIEAGWREKKA